MQISDDGLFYGTPDVWTYIDINFLVTDYSNITSVKSLLFYACLTDIEAHNPGSSDLNLSGSPNPFSDKAFVSFTLPDEETVNLSVYNLNGQLVRTILHQKNLGSGKYVFDWSGFNEKGNKVKSGLYYCILSLPDYTESVKLLYLK